MASTTQLQYIVSLAKERHFGKAANACNVSQPSLSMQIQKLEEELDVVIFDRSKKPIIPTQTGEEIVKQAEIVLKEHKRLADIATQGTREPRGEFRLAVIPTLAPYLIPLFVNEFSKTYPKVDLKISESQTNDILDQLASDQIDAALLVTPLNDPSLIERHLFFEPFYAYISEEHTLSNRKFLNESDLDDHNLWLLEEGHCFRNQVLKVCGQDRKNKALGNVEFSSGNLETLKNLVKKSSGYTLLPELAICELSSTDIKKHVKKFKKPVPTREVSLVHSRSFLKQTTLNALETVILTQLPKNIRSLKKQEIEIVEIF